MLPLIAINTTSLTEAALLYARQGIPVFPCKGKKPLVQRGFKSATIDSAQVQQWWQQFPTANIGSPTGRKSFVLDIDLPDGPDSLTRLVEQNSALPVTLEQRTGSGGRHLFFNNPEGIILKNSAGKIGNGLDIRAQGGYVILPPSLHERGTAYQWTENGIHTPARCPQWLTELLCTESNNNVLSVASNPEQLIQSVAEAHPGQRNEALNRAAFLLGQYTAAQAVSGKEAFSLLSQLKQAALLSGLTHKETERTADNAFQAGREKVVPESVPLYNPFETLEIQQWPVPEPAMFHGFAGEFTHYATAHSEADPVAVLATFLCRFAVEAGRHSYMPAGGRQHARLNAVLVGQSSKARKGTSAYPVRQLFSFAEGKEDWCYARETPGPLSTGEGLIYAVRDAQQSYILDKNSGTGKQMTTDPGVEDKRLFVLDQEFASALSCTRREGNTLSAIIRALFDGDTVEPLTKAHKIRATDPHIGIVTHITLHELHRKLDITEAFNGFANRFLWLCVRRPKLVPFPQELEATQLKLFQQQLVHCLNTIKDYGHIDFDRQAHTLWEENYPAISADRPALSGSVLNRAEVYIRRLALTYALLDQAGAVSPAHLQAALSVWKFCEESVSFIFGGFVADPAERKLLEALEKNQGSMDMTALYRSFGNHISREKMLVLLNSLTASGKITIEEIRPAPLHKKGGRPRKIIHLKLFSCEECEVCEETTNKKK